MRFRPAVVLLVLAGLALLGSARAHAADLPSRWCGADETAVDRPDAVASYQVHVIYAYPADGTARFATAATSIARDIAGIDAWWRLQDSSRAPRWDFASFPGCDSIFGALDIASVKLPQPAGAYAGGGAFGLIRTDLTSIATSRYKKYLVYYDGPVAASELCGVSVAGPADSGGDAGVAGPSIVYLQPATEGCLIGEFGDGNGWLAKTAVHELIHSLNPPFPDGTAPHACPGDPGHVCDTDHDVLYGKPSSIGTLGQSALDLGRDDYYGHGGAWWDVRNSLWLRHLEAPQYRVGVTVSGSGTVESDLPGLDCPTLCSATLDSGTQVTLTPTPGDGYDFVRWTGACSGDSCALTMGADAAVTAVFVRDVTVSAKVNGKGSITGDLSCRVTCADGFAEGTTVSLGAVPAKGWKFAGWSGACRSKSKHCAFPASSGARAVAKFTKSKRR